MGLGASASCPPKRSLPFYGLSELEGTVDPPGFAQFIPFPSCRHLSSGKNEAHPRRGGRGAIIIAEDAAPAGGCNDGQSFTSSAVATHGEAQQGSCGASATFGLFATGCATSHTFYAHVSTQVRVGPPQAGVRCRLCTHVACAWVVACQKCGGVPTS